MRRENGMCSACPFAPQYLKNFQGFRQRVDSFKSRLQHLLTSLPVRCHLRCLRRHWLAMLPLLACTMGKRQA